MVGDISSEGNSNATDVRPLMFTNSRILGHTAYQHRIATQSFYTDYDVDIERWAEEQDRVCEEYQHPHHHLRHEDALLHPPSLIPQRTNNHFPPLQPPGPQPHQLNNHFLPPQPPPQPHQPYNHFPPLQSPPPQPHQPHILLRQLPQLHIVHPPQPPHSNLTPHRFNHYQISLPPKPYIDHKFLPPTLPPHPPKTRENTDRQFPWDDNSRDGGISVFGRCSNDEMGYDEKRCDSIMNYQDSKKMDCDETRRGSIDGWICGLYKDEDMAHDERRMGSGICEGQFVMSKKCRLQKESAMSKAQSGEDCSRENQHLTEEPSCSSFRGKEKEEGFKHLQTRIDDKRDCEAILGPPCPDDFKKDINSTIVETEIKFSLPGPPTMVKSVEDEVKAADLWADDGLGVPKVLLNKAVVSESGSVGDDATGSGEIDVKDQSRKDIKLQQTSTIANPRCMQTRNYSDDTNDTNGCIVPLASPLQPCSDANGLVEIASDNLPQKDTNLHIPIVRKASWIALRKKLKRVRAKLLQKTSVQMKIDSGNVVIANNDCIIPSSAPAQPHSRANNDSGVIPVKNQPQNDMNSNSHIVCASRSGRPKKWKKAKMKLLQKTSLQMKIDSGRANDCINPSVSSQPRSCAKDLGDFAVKNQPWKQRNLHMPMVIGSCWEAKKKILHETGMMMINDNGDIVNISDCIIPSAPLRSCSGANGLGKIAWKNQPQKGTNLHSPTVRRFHSTHLKKWKARNKLLHETITGSEKAGSNCDSCKPVVPYLKRTSSSTTLSASPYVANSVIPECFPMLETSTEEAKVQHYVHCTFLAKVSARHGGSVGFNHHGNDVDKVVSMEAPVVFDTEKNKIESVDQYANLGIDRVVDNNSERPLHNGSPLVYSVRKGINISGSCQGDICSSEIHASSECDSAFSLNPDSGIISGVGSAGANVKEVFLRELDSLQVVKSDVNISREATISVSSEIGKLKCFKCGERGHTSSLCRKLKCFKCGERGHTSSLCRKLKAANNAVRSKICRLKCFKCREHGHISSLCPKVRAANNASSSKIWKQKCYVCREHGHISSSCPMVKTANNAVSSKYGGENAECGENGHISSWGPKVNADDSTNPDKETGDLNRYAHVKLDAVPKKGTVTNLKLALKDNQVQSNNFSVVNEVQVFSTGKPNSVSSSKTRKRKFYECRESGHIKSLCPKRKADDSVNAGQEIGELKGYAHVKLNAVPNKGTVTNLKSASKDNQVRSSYNFSAVNEVQIFGTSKSNSVSSSKTRKRKCYECGECGHIKSLCPKIKADDSANADKGIISDVGSADVDSEVFLKELNTLRVVSPEISGKANNAVSSKIRCRRCYGCGESGHISSSCPKVKANDSTNQDKETGELKGYANVNLDAIQKRGTATTLNSAPKDNLVQSSYNLSVVNEVIGTSRASLDSSSKMRWQLCYGCQEQGHIISVCPKRKADDSAIAISKYISKYLAAPCN